MTRFVAGILAGFLILAAGAYLFIIVGGMPVAVRGNSLPLERWIARTSIHAAIGKDADKASPISATEPNLTHGAKEYTEHCAGCHGIPNHPSSIGKAMYPHAPQLFDPNKGVTDDPAGETYWKVKNGIRLTGMPAFTDILDETEIWQISLLLKNADHLPEAAIHELK